MNKQNHIDQQTALPNRELLLDRLSQALLLAWRQQAKHAMLHVIIDGWQSLLTTYGQTELDRLSHQIGQEFTTVLRKEDTVVSLDNGEFAILISYVGSHSVATTTDVGHIAHKLIHVFEHVFTVAEASLLFSISIGIAMLPDDGEDAVTIINNAKKCASDLSQRGGDGFAFYAPKLQRQSDSRKMLIQQLQQALKTEQMQIYYQPMVNEQGQIFSLEALLYWQHPEQGLIGPEQFIPLAEECGLIQQLGAWVIKHACQQFLEFRQADNRGQLLRLAINISPLQFYASGFYQTMLTTIKQTGIAPEQLVLEVTEGLMQQDRERASAILLQLSALGVALAIDDFGTGYSSLVDLERLPLQQLKLDQSFVDNIKEPYARKIIKTAIAISQLLDLELIAKGVENRTQHQQLHQLGCLKYQGFLFNKPMNADDVSQLLSQEDLDLAVF